MRKIKRMENQTTMKEWEIKYFHEQQNREYHIAMQQRHTEGNKLIRRQEEEVCEPPPPTICPYCGGINGQGVLKEGGMYTAICDCVLYGRPARAIPENHLPW